LRSQGRAPLSRSAERETKPRRFFFDSFFLCASYLQRKKRLTNLCKQSSHQKHYAFNLTDTVREILGNRAPYVQKSIFILLR